MNRCWGLRLDRLQHWASHQSKKRGKKTKKHARARPKLRCRAEATEAGAEHEFESRRLKSPLDV